MLPPEQLAVSRGGIAYARKRANAPVGLVLRSAGRGASAAHAAWCDAPTVPEARPRLRLLPRGPRGCGHTQRAPLQLRCADPGLARSRGRPALASRPAASSGTRVTAEGHTAVRDPRQHVRFSGNERREVNSSVEETPEPVMPHVFLLAVQVAACGGRYPSLTAEGPRGGCRAGPRTAARWLVWLVASW